MRWMLLIAVLGSCSSGTKHDEGAPVPPQAQAPQPTPVTPMTPATPAPPMPKVTLSTPHGDVVVEVEVVATSALIERGLMFREHLPPDQGMLFFMKDERIWPFWMHNTLIPLDMIFIAKTMTIAGIVENAEPRTDTLRQIELPSLYVLEVNGGFSAAHKLSAGTKVRFDNLPAR